MRGDVFEEDEPKSDVLVFRSIHVVTQLVGGELGLASKPRWAGDDSKFFGFTGRAMTMRWGPQFGGMI